MVPSKHNDALTKWLEQTLLSHVQPSEDVANAHDAKIKKLICDIEEELPKQSALFKGCSAELVGSAGGCGTKVGEANEYDINITLQLPFPQEEITLNFDDSSPTYASIEVSENIVRSVLTDLSLCDIENANNFYKGDKREDFDIFVKRNGKYIISSQKVRSHLGVAQHHLNRFNANGGGSSNQGPAHQNDFYPRLFQDVILIKTDYGFAYFVHDLKFSVDISCCIRLPLTAFKHHPKIPYAINRISSLVSAPDDAMFAYMIPKKSKQFEEICPRSNCLYILRKHGIFCNIVPPSSISIPPFSKNIICNNTSVLEMNFF